MGKMRWLAVAGVLAGCGGGGDGSLVLATPDHCNPLGGASCMTPWPSGLYERADATSPTGRRLDIPAGALLTNVDGIPVDPAPINGRDGFSPAAPIILAFPGGVDPSNLVHYSNYPASTTAASPTVLLHMDTGELVEHFAEIDARVPDQPDRQALYIRPSKLLDGGARYAVAIKKTLKGKGGGDLPVPEGFQAILDGRKTTHPLLERARPRLEEVLVALEAQGIGRQDLVVAWDFTVMTREAMRADVLAARTAAMAAMGPDGANLTFTVTSDVPSSDERIARRIDGEFDAPLFLTDAAFTPTTVLLRGADGKPALMGMYRAPFTAIIPKCALDGRPPVPILLYGHGLLGDSSQVASAGVRIAASELCVVAVGTDMRGMSKNDLPNVGLALNDLNKGSLVFEGLVQGVIDHIAMVEAARGPMATQLFVDANGNSIVDPSRVYYYGISQGGIFGTTHCAYSPRIGRCVLQVGAINYSMMLERSLDWPAYRTLLIGAYPDPLDVSLAIHLMQMMWDMTEPTSIADALLVPGAIPDTPTKQVLMQIAVADDEVTNIASDYQARSMGLAALAPSFYEPHGVPVLEGPLSSAYVIYDFGLGHTIPPTNEPPPDNNVHSLVRKQRATIEMMRRFYADGQIVQTCTAPNGCDCTVENACGGEL